MKLTEEQQKAYKALQKFIGSNEKFFVFEGVAGAGKTTIIQKLALLYHDTIYWQVICVTNKACQLYRQCPVAQLQDAITIFKYRGSFVDYTDKGTIRFNNKNVVRDQCIEYIKHYTPKCIEIAIIETLFPDIPNNILLIIQRYLFKKNKYEPIPKYHCWETKTLNKRRDQFNLEFSKNCLDVLYDPNYYNIVLKKCPVLVKPKKMVVIIDECSMINSLSYYEKFNCQIIFVGDRYQLPPVEYCRNISSPVFAIQANHTKLNKCVRSNTQYIQKLNQFCIDLIDKQHYYEFEPNIEWKELNTLYGCKNFIYEIKKRLDNEKTFRILTYFNKTKNWYNRFCINYLKYINDESHPYQKGVPLIANKTFYCSDQRFLCYKQDKCKIMETATETTRIRSDFFNKTFDVYRVKIQTDNDKIKYVQFISTDEQKECFIKKRKTKMEQIKKIIDKINRKMKTKNIIEEEDYLDQSNIIKVQKLLQSVKLYDTFNELICKKHFINETFEDENKEVLYSIEDAMNELLYWIQDANKEDFAVNGPKISIYNVKQYIWKLYNAEIHKIDNDSLQIAFATTTYSTQGDTIDDVLVDLNDHYYLYHMKNNNDQNTQLTALKSLYVACSRAKETIILSSIDFCYSFADYMKIIENREIQQKEWSDSNRDDWSFLKINKPIIMNIPITIDNVCNAKKLGAKWSHFMQKWYIPETISAEQKKMLLDKFGSFLQ